MKRFILVLTLLVPSFLCGCSVMSSFGGLAIWSAAASRTVITNNTSQYRFVVLMNGRIKNEYFVMPGDSFNCDARNFYDKGTQEFTITVKAYDRNNAYVGVTEKKFSLGSFEQDCTPWTINTTDLRMAQ